MFMGANHPRHDRQMTGHERVGDPPLLAAAKILRPIAGPKGHPLRLKFLTIAAGVDLITQVKAMKPRHRHHRVADQIIGVPQGFQPQVVFRRLREHMGGQI